jgi:nucleotide-binding universal stress UspA family protein
MPDTTIQPDLTAQPYDENGTYAKQIERKISEVVAKRQALVQRVQPVHTHLGQLLQEITALKQGCQNLKGTFTDDEIRQSLEKVNFATIEITIQTELQRLQQLIDRFTRSTLNIGVVGRMRQGKSTFLQRLSNLSNDILPARPGSACTAVRSKIYHHDAPTKALITRHTEQTFLQEVIAPYYKQLQLGAPPRSLDEFAAASLPSTPTQGAADQAMYSHLYQDYYLTLPQYRSKLALTIEPIEVENEAEIAAYVAQTRDDQGRLKTFDHLVVRDAEIYCQFQRSYIQKLGLVDVPGLGDLRLGDEDLILQTLAREVDVVLFFRRPDAKGDQWQSPDTKLYDLAAQALPGLAQRSFMVLNHQRTDGDNEGTCKFLEETITSLGKMQVVEPLIADCNSSDEAHVVLNRVLQYLDQQIEALEKQYAQFCQDQLLALHQLIQTELAQIADWVRPFAAKGLQFNRLFDRFMIDLANGLRDLVDQLHSQQEETDRHFEKAVQEALKKCEIDSGVPSAEDIKDRCRARYHNSYKATHCMCVAELRAHLSETLLILNTGLQQTADQLKEQVAQILINQVGLGSLADAQGAALLAAMADRLQQEHNPLALGFATLANFNIDYEELLLNWIQRDLMSVLNPDGVMQRHELEEAAAQATAVMAELAAAAGIQATTPVSQELVGHGVEAVHQLATAAIDAVFDLNPETVHTRLTILHQQAINKCRNTLNNWLNVPSKIRHGAAAQFVDCVLDGEDARIHWDVFLRDPKIQARVWDEFAPIEELQKWLETAQQVSKLNQRKTLVFLP